MYKDKYKYKYNDGTRTGVDRNAGKLLKRKVYEYTKYGSECRRCWNAVAD